MSASEHAVFHDRAEAGRRLAAGVERLRRAAPVVLGISAGGVLVAAEVVEALSAPFDVVVIRSLGEPGARFGAVAEGGLAIVHHDRARAAGFAAEDVARLRVQAEDTADSAGQRLRAGRSPYDVVGRTVLLVDDGTGTGDAAIAAARTARRRGAARIVLAVPTGSASVVQRLRAELDEVICLETASSSLSYAEGERPAEREVVAALGGTRSGGRLNVPEGARGAIVLAGGDELVLRQLRDKAFAVLVLPPAATSEHVAAGVRQLQLSPATAHLALGVFGLGRAAEPAATAAGLAGVRAVVIAGGRTERIPKGGAATLVIVGGEDRHGLALARASGLETAIVPGAGHDLAEPGVLEQVAHLASGWLVRRLHAAPDADGVRSGSI